MRLREYAAAKSGKNRGVQGKETETMSKQALQSALDRAIDDADFRSQLASDPNTALAGYDLSPDERTAFMSADQGQLEQHLGPLDDRTSKSVMPFGAGWGGGGGGGGGTGM
jgi:hypothetical protein